MPEQNNKNEAKQTEAKPTEAIPKMASSSRDGVDATELKSVDVEAEMRALGEEYMQTMGTPKVMKPSEFARKLAQIENLVRAKSPDDKKRVKMALVHVGVVYGTGPNIDYKEVMLVPGGGTTPVLMSKVVDGITTREYHRRFMNGLGDLIASYVNANPSVQAGLVERAVRAGIPVTKAVAVVDFGPQSMDNMENVGYRHLAKTSAVNRANTNHDSSLVSKAKNSVADAQSVDDRRMSNSASMNRDKYGPV